MSNKNVQDLLSTAIAMAACAHEGVLDRGGNAYITHPIRIMMRLRTNDAELMSIAILHDTIEDAPDIVSFKALIDAGFSTRVINALQLLTHSNDDSYEDYIKKIATNKDALRVKLEDLKDNSDLTRLKGVTQKDFNRVIKYQKAYTYLSRILTASEEVDY